MKNILAENMLRFLPKNLSPTDIKNIQLIIEASDPEKDPTKPDTGNKTDPKNAGSVPTPDVKVGAEQPYGTKNKSAVWRMGGQMALEIERQAKKKNPNYQEYEQELINYAGQEMYEAFISHFENSDVNTSVKIWYLRLDQAARKYFLDEFRKGYKPGKKYAVSFKFKSSRVEKTSKPLIEKIKRPTLPGSLNIAGDDVFTDNESDVTPKVQEKINEFINSISKQKEEYIKENPGVNLQFKLVELDVAASASRFRNTQQASNLSWAELTKMRGEKVKQLILTELTKIGVDIKNVKVTPIGLGYNKDGTSGPQPGKDEQGRQYAITSDGKAKNVIAATPEILNKFGAPKATKAEYDQFKFVVATALIFPIVPNEIEQRPESEEVYYKNYTMQYYEYRDRKPVKVKHSRGGMKLDKKPVENYKKGKKISLACGIDSNDTGDEWWYHLDHWY